MRKKKAANALGINKSENGASPTVILVDLANEEVFERTSNYIGHIDQIIFEKASSHIGIPHGRIR